MFSTRWKPVHAMGRLTAALLAAAVTMTMLSTVHAVNTDESEKPDAKDTSPVHVHMTTSKGDIYLKLNREKAPITVENFVQYVKDEFYDGTIFHRVIENFMIQGGGFTEELQQKRTRSPIENEWQNGLKNERGTIAMARTTNPDSATAQFFINVRNNRNLDQPISGGAGYAVFGKVVHGMDVVDAIRKVETTRRGGHPNVPTEPVIIEKVRIITKDDLERATRPDERTDDADGNTDDDS